jgi:hypothetical protein
MAGYSGKPLAQKLGIRAGHRVALVDAPAGFDATLAPLPADVVLRDTRGDGAASADVLLLFAREQAVLAPELTAAARALPRGAMLWVAWPKRASRQPTDVTEDVVRRLGLATGLVDVKVCAVDEVWSGLKFLHRRVTS